MPATYRAVTLAEACDVIAAIECGAFQIESHPPQGVAQRWTTGMPVYVYHQATGHLLPGTETEVRINARLAELHKSHT